MSAFLNLDASEEGLEDNGITEIDSCCMSCYKQGRTRLMLTKIPFYRDVVISSFNCDHCHITNNTLESANKIQERGTRIKLEVTDEKDLNRELVKSDNAILLIPSIEFEIPAKTQKGYLTTVEGVLDRVITSLQSDIELRKESDKETAGKLQTFVDKLSDLKKLKLGKFDLIIDDPSGDSFIENPQAPKKDPRLVQTYYKRTPAQNEDIGIFDDKDLTDDLLMGSENEIASFQNNCPNCNAVCETNMKITEIPYFKKIILMCSACEHCGMKTAEVKSGTGIEPKGVRFTLKLTDPSDLNRDLLKSDTASFEIPEIDFFMTAGTLGDKFTTIEGILSDLRENLDNVSPFGAGDSETRDKSNKMQVLLDTIGLIQKGEKLDVTIILEDASGNSYLQNTYAPEDDPNMLVEHFERNYDQNEILGLNDMNTDNYMTEEQKERLAASELREKAQLEAVTEEA